MNESPAEPASESGAKSGTESDPQVRVLLKRAFDCFAKGEKLPPPATWQELLVGMVVWLAEKWSDDEGHRPCSNCGSRDWEVGSVVSLEANPRWPAPEGREHGTFPHFQVSCRDCGNVILVNALTVFEPQEPATSDIPPES
jgi:hypothetical protein